MIARAEPVRRLARRLKTRLGRFARNARAAVAVEMAFILPIFASMAFLTWDAGTLYTQYNRSISNLYSLGDIVSTRTRDLTCNELDAISELVYRSYVHGNWARRTDGGGFTQNGAPDFRFGIAMVRAETLPGGDIRGVIEWEYVRAGRNARLPLDLIDIPPEMQIDGQRFVLINGYIHLRPSMNYLGIFDMNPLPDREDGLFETEFYFPLRFVQNVALVQELGDLFDPKCRG